MPNKSDRINLLSLTREELIALIISWNAPRFRATQIWRWIYHTLTDSFDEMVNLPKDLRQKLAENTYIGRLETVDRLISEDELTEKIVFKTLDGHFIESVLMHYTNRHTVCVSSQIGCALGCVFCATGHSGFERDLTAGEISAQVLHFSRQLADRNAHVTNVVLMGMGEPMMNYDNVWKSIINLNDGEGLALGTRRFTLSTVGIAPAIERMAGEGMAVGLAVSLHAPDDELRNKLVPINRRYPLGRVLEACHTYVQATGRRITFEYALLEGINDSDECALETAKLLSGMLCHVNLIPVNPSPGCEYTPSQRARAMAFQDILVKNGIQTTVRVSRGADIEAGCGQLRERYLERRGANA